MQFGLRRRTFITPLGGAAAWPMGSRPGGNVTPASQKDRPGQVWPFINGTGWPVPLDNYSR
jgi:hypothetical protein